MEVRTKLASENEVEVNEEFNTICGQKRDRHPKHLFLVLSIIDGS